MRLKDLETYLQPLRGFHSPKVELEQYVTSAHLASRMVFTAHSTYNDIESKDILDLGCGCGILSIASQLLGSAYTLGIDLDEDALEVARENLGMSQIEEEEEERGRGSEGEIHKEEEDPKDSSILKESIEFIKLDISEPNFEDQLKSITLARQVQKNDGFKFDTVIMNPPFGTKRKGIDMIFLEKACQLARSAIYSLHKSSTRDYIRKKSTSWGFQGEVVAEMKYDLPRTLKMHKYNSLDIMVDLWRFKRIKAS